jgi:hypothetical protein
MEHLPKVWGICGETPFLDLEPGKADPADVTAIVSHKQRPPRRRAGGRRTPANRKADTDAALKRQRRNPPKSDRPRPVQAAGDLRPRTPRRPEGLR